jgi:hypothetical protein
MSDAGRSQGCIALLSAFVAGIVVGGVAGHGLGQIVGETRLYRARIEEERKAVAPAIAGDPAFKNVEIGEDSSGSIWLIGTVPTTADKKRLKELVTRAIGSQRAELVTHVDAEDAQR